MDKRNWLIDLRGNQTQDEVAADAGISRALYTQIETGARNPSVATAKAIARVLSFDWPLFFAENCHETQQS